MKNHYSKSHDDDDDDRSYGGFVYLFVEYGWTLTLMVMTATHTIRTEGSKAIILKNNQGHSIQIWKTVDFSYICEFSIK